MKALARHRVIFSAIAVILVSAIASLVALNKNTYAAPDSVIGSWFIAGHHNCIQSAASETLPIDNDDTIESLMYTGVNKNFTIPAPSLNYGGASKSDPTCGDILNGDGTGSFGGVLSRVGLRVGATMKDIKNSNYQIESLGYSPEGGRQRIEVFIRKTAIDDTPGDDEIQKASEYIRATQLANGQYKYEVINEGDDHPNISVSQKDNNTINIKYRFTAMNPKGGGWVFTCWGGMDEPSSIDVALPTSSVDEAIAAIRKAMPQAYGLNGEVQCGNGFGSTWNVNHSVNATTIAEGGYSLGNRTEASRRAVEKLAGPSDDPADPLKTIRPTDDQYYDLYYYYLKNSIPNWGDSPTSSGVLSCDQASSNSREIHLKTKEGRWHKYYINSSDLNKSFKTIAVNGDDVTFPDITVDSIIEWMNLHEANDESTTCPAPLDAENTDKIKTGEDECFSAADSLGWIVCPIIKGASAAVNTIYDDIIEPFLKINVSSFETGNGAYQAWQFFQSIANIIFVILFLVVIISQITGVGIDNLGIKRILPKLIIAAVLVNLSYIICILLVDVSNIAGYGFKRFFDSISISGIQGGATGGTVIGNLLAVLGLAGGAALIAWSPALVPAILLGILSLLISILTMFVILGVYQAGVIIAVVVSPIAFVLYMLPNTKPIFDRWRKLFQALLLLYPLCGLMMGGAAFAGKVIQSVADGFWFTLLGALLSVIPFFFIPKILQSSMSAMGNIGAKISGIGKGLSGKTTGAIQNSEAYKDMMARRAAGVNRNGDLTARGKLMRRMAKGKVGPDGKEKKGIIARAATRQLARGQVGYRKREDEIAKGATLFDPNNMAAQEIAQQKAVEKEALAAQMALVNDETRNGEDEGTLYQMFDEAVSSGNATRARAITEIAGRRKDSASRFAEKLKKDSIEGKYANAEGSEMLRSISKQIATGDNSKNFREGNAGGFEFAARTNDGSNTVYNYADWISDGDNVKRVTDNYLNTPEGLASQTNASLREFSGEAVKDKATGKVLYQANISKAKDSLAKTANKYYENQKVGGVYYSDKEDNMAKIRDLKSSSPGALPIDSGDDAGDAKEDQSYKVQ